MRWIVEVATHCGSKRKENDDAYALSQESGIYIVCDGTRHLAGAAVAKQCAEAVVESWNRSVQPRAQYQADPSRKNRQALEILLADAIRAANTHIHGAALADPSRVGAYTTLDAVAILGEQAIISHVGDGRIYLVREGRWYQLTRDHTRAEEMRASGLWKDEALKASPFRQELTRALGAASTLVPDLFSVPLNAGDLIVICSNGLSDLFLDPTAKSEAEKIAQAKDRAPAQSLVEWAAKKGSNDNVTSIAIRVPSTEALHEQKESTVGATTARRILVNPQIAQAMQSVPVFQSLKNNPRGLMSLLGQTSVKTFTAGQTLVVQGGGSDELLVILEGIAEVLEYANVVATRKPGDVIGEIGFFSGSPRMASVIAKDAVKALTLRREDFEQLLDRDPRLGLDLARGVIQELGRKLASQQKPTHEVIHF